MKLTFKNKMIMAIQAMCDEGAKKGGIPREITVSSKEAHAIIREMNFLKIQSKIGALQDRKWVGDALKITPKELKDLEDPYQPAHLIKQLMGSGNHTELALPPDEVSDQTVTAICDCWFKESITMRFDYNNVRVPIAMESYEPEGKYFDPKSNNWTS